MKKTTTTMSTTLTNSGLPVIYETGGFFRDSGKAQIITDGYGRPCSPIFVVRHGHRLDRPHAYFVLKEGYYVIKISFSMASYPRVGKVRGIEIKILTFRGEIRNIEETEEFDFRGRLRKMKCCDIVLEEVLNVEKEGDYKQVLSNFSLPSNLYFLKTAFDEALAKMHCHNCRQPHYLFPKFFLFPEEERYDDRLKLECAFDNARSNFCDNSLFFSKNKERIKDFLKTIIKN